MWRCCSRTDIGISSRKLSSVHLTAATDRRFHCDIDFGKNLYLYESLVVCMSLFELLCGYCLVLGSDGVSKFVGYTCMPLHIHTYSQNKHTHKKNQVLENKKSQRYCQRKDFILNNNICNIKLQIFRTHSQTITTLQCVSQR
jgi:hypothetical protein